MVIDSHVLYWWLEGHPRLSPQALQIIEAAETGTTQLPLSPVSFWELARKEGRGSFSSRRPVREWPGILDKADWIEIVPTTTQIWLLSAELNWAHKDPADRIIAATALLRGVPVLTRDRLFHQSDCPVEAVW
jgi:PIN domain nuclease of toxin-antitoxin system